MANAIKRDVIYQKNANILLLPKLFYNKFEIIKTINILKKLIKCLDFNNYIFEDKIVIIKKNRLIV